MDEVKLDGGCRWMKLTPRFLTKGTTKILNYHAHRINEEQWRQDMVYQNSKFSFEGINLNGLSIAKIANLGRPNVADLQKVLGGKIAQDSVFVTDSLRSYQKLSFDMDLNHMRIPRNKYKNGVFNIQTVNNYHKPLKYLIFGTFKGVAIKYLNNYLVYHNFVNLAKDIKANKQVILFDFIRNTFCQSRTGEIAKRPALPI